MAKVLQNFLIGVGLDTEKYDKGAKSVEGSLGRMRTLVGFTGAAFTGAFGLAGTAAVNAGKRVHDFNIEAEKLKTPTEYVHNYGRALAALGGNAEEALAAISAIEKAQSDFKLAGMLGPLENVALARGDISALSQTKDGAEFLRTLAGMAPQMDKDQRRMVQDAIGLSDVVMISLSEGVEAFDAGIARAAELYGDFGRATDQAREFVRALGEINTRFQGIGETLAERMLPGFTGLIDSVGTLIDRNRDNIDEVAGVLGDNPTATSLAAGGGAASAAGAALRGVGLRGIGTGLTRLGTPGMVAGGGLLAYDAAKDWDWDDWWSQSKDSVRDTWRGATRQDDHSHLPDVPYGSEVPIVAPGGTESLPPAHGNFLPLNETHYTDDHRPDPIGESATSGFVTPYGDHPAIEPHISIDSEGAPAWWQGPYSGVEEYPNVEQGGYERITAIDVPDVPVLPVYAGGEVDNVEAASASPEVIMLKDQREQADKPPAAPRINVQNHLEVQMEMDGRAVDTRVIDVIERRERDTIDDIYSSVDR